MGQYYTNDVNTTKSIISVLVIVGLSIASLGQISNVMAENDNFMPYGSIANEDQLYTIYKGDIWINVVPSKGNGQFMQITDLETSYTVNEALDRFYPSIQEDTNQFEVMPSVYSNVSLIYQFNDETLFFELLGAVQ